MAQEITKTERILSLLIMLQQRRTYTVPELSSRLHVSPRTVFRDIKELQDMGFEVSQNDGRYCIRHDSIPQKFKSILSSSDAGVESTTADFENSSQREKVMQLTAQLSLAIENKRTIRLYDYHSSRGTTFPRTLEPFLLSPNDTSLWAFDTAKSACRQFKIMRMGDVEILETPWQNTHKHKLPFNDIFNLSAAAPIDTIKLRLSPMAYNLLTEEHPESIHCQSKKDPMVFTIPVADYRGSGRFVLGLMDALEVLGSEDFKSYLRHVVKTSGKFT